MKYAPTSHNGLTFSPPCAAAPAGMSRTNARPTNISASANFAGDDGWRGPRLTHSPANTGDSRITNTPWTATNQAAYRLRPRSSTYTYRSLDRLTVATALTSPRQ